MPHPNLAELNALVVLAGRRNFRIAAGELGISASALSHLIATLEKRLGVRLFNRTTRSVALTAAGEALLTRVRPALKEIAEAVEAVNAHRDTPAGVLRLNSSVSAAQEILGPILLEFLRRYPDMQLDIVTEGRLVDIVAGGFDAGIRVAELVPQDMIAVPLSGPKRFVIAATPDYLMRSGRPVVPDDLRHHECIRWRLPSGALDRWQLVRGHERVELDVPGRLLLDSAPLIIEAALGGMGLAHVNEWSVRDALADGRLEAVMSDWTPSFPGLRLYYSGHRHVPAGLKALVALIREVNAARGVG
ncbi:MAG: LysR family transcriptional regulator [Devosia sp.]|nr:LysR family transcriptional regulator [Devosia sp.]